MVSLAGKWALVTGSSRGIGQKIATGLAAKDCNLVLHASRAENCAATLEMISRFNIDRLVLGGKLGNQDEEQKLVDSIMENIGHLDILYNNAAIMSNWYDRISDIPMQEWQRIYEVNFFSLVRLSNAFYPVMSQRQWGRIVNLVTGMADTPQLLPYSASKASVEKYTKELAAELKDSNVLVNALDPGWLKTDMGGQNADHDVETVLPGALVPALLDDDGPSGEIFHAQDYVNFSME